jgi:hypothetical protein
MLGRAIRALLNNAPTFSRVPSGPRVESELEVCGSLTGKMTKAPRFHTTQGARIFESRGLRVEGDLAVVRCRMDWQSVLSGRACPDG